MEEVNLKKILMRKTCRPLIKRRVQDEVRWETLTISTVIVIAYFLMGLVYGFGNNPRASTWVMVVINSGKMVVKLVCIECTRKYLVGLYVKDRVSKRIIIIGVLLGCLNVWWITLTQLEDVLTITLWIVGNVLPEIIRSIVATYLILYGGITASILYLLLTKSGEWISPILPDINIFTKGLFEIFTGWIVWYWMTINTSLLVKRRKA